MTLKKLEILFIIFSTTLIIFPNYSFGQIFYSGTHVEVSYDSPHPYTPTKNKGEITWTQRITYTDKKARYLCVHFDQFCLAPGDTLIIRSPDKEDKRGYVEFTHHRNDWESVWSNAIYGNELIIEIISNNSFGDYGYSINKIARGFTEEELKYREENNLTGPEDIDFESIKMEYLNKTVKLKRKVHNLNIGTQGVVCEVTSLEFCFVEFQEIKNQIIKVKLKDLSICN